MKNIFKNPLFFKEWRNVKWISLIVLLNLIITKVLGLTASLENIKSHNLTNPYNNFWFGNSLLNMDSYTFTFIFLIILLTIILFQNERNSSTYSFTASMPFKRESVISIKWITGVLAIILPFLITFIIITLFYFKNIQWIQQPYILVPQWFMINTLTYVAIFSFLIFIETLMGQNTPSAIIGSIIILVPVEWSMGIMEILSKHNIKISSFTQEILAKISGYMTLYVYNAPSYSRDIHHLYYEQLNIKAIILIIVCIVTLALSIYCYKKNSLENTGHLVLFKPFEYILKLGIGISLGFLMYIIFGFSWLGRTSLVLTYILLILGFVLGYFGTDKYIKYTCK